MQGLFEARQKEVSEEFAAFLAARVLTAPRLLHELANGTHRADFEALLRRAVPASAVPFHSRVHSHVHSLLPQPASTVADRAASSACSISSRGVVPFVVPDAVVRAAGNGVRDLALEEMSHPAHEYIAEALSIEPTLCHRLQLLSPTNFENLLHPVFKEDEVVLIIVGGVLGAAAGLVQLRYGWGGPTAIGKMAAARL